MTLQALTQLALDAYIEKEAVSERDGCLRDNSGFITVKPFPSQLYLANVYTSGAERGKGIARGRIERLCAIADKLGLPVLVSIAAFSVGRDAPALSDSQLKTWYKSFGFKGNGRAYSMLRPPKTTGLPSFKAVPVAKGDIVDIHGALFSVTSTSATEVFVTHLEQGFSSKFDASFVSKQCQRAPVSELLPFLGRSSVQQRIKELIA